MRIAMIAPIIERVPPKKYGGTERVVYLLTEELVNRGHDVTLFAGGDSITSAKLESIYPRSLREAKTKDYYGPNELVLHHLGAAYAHQEQFEIIHDHTGIISFPTANISKTPVVMTMHGQFSPNNGRLYRFLLKPYQVAISHAQENYGPKEANIAGVVYNGLNMENYPFSKGNDGYLLFVGRFSMEKGAHLAIEVAQELDMPLILAAKLDIIDMPYFDEYIKPRLSDERVRWIGEVDENERNTLMSRAVCMLHPITWREPFGLTLIEAMACGCPVIAFNSGSIPEIIVDGKTGFVVDDVDEMIDSVGKSETIDRMECRKHALKNFNDKKMTDGYVKIYEKILEGGN